MSNRRAAEYAVDQQILQRFVVVFKRLDIRRDHRLQFCLAGAIEKVVAVNGAHEARHVRRVRPHERRVVSRHEQAVLADQLARGCHRRQRRADVLNGKAEKRAGFLLRKGRHAARKPAQCLRQRSLASGHSRPQVGEHLVDEIPLPVPFAVILILIDAERLLKALKNRRDFLHQPAGFLLDLLDIERPLAAQKLKQRLLSRRHARDRLSIERGEERHIAAFNPAHRAGQPHLDQRAAALTQAIVCTVVKGGARRQRRRLSEAVPIDIAAGLHIAVQCGILPLAHRLSKALPRHAQRYDAFLFHSFPSHLPQCFSALILKTHCL